MYRRSKDSQESSKPSTGQALSYISDTILAKDIKILQKIQSTIGQRCQIVIVFIQYNVGGSARSMVASIPDLLFFTPKLSSDASAAMKSWGWKTSGPVDILESAEDENLAIESLRQQAHR